MRNWIVSREDNRRKHSKPGSVPYTAKLELHIVATEIEFILLAW
jgi:hypothetical protein